MKKHFLLLGLSLSLFFSGVSKAQTVNPSNIYTFNYEGKTYEVIKEKKSWSEASEIARQRGGYLVEINNEAENTAVYSAVTNGAGVSAMYTSVNDGGGVAYVWIGGTDKQTEGTWIWDGNDDGQGDTFTTGQGLNGVGNFCTHDTFYFWGGLNEPENAGVPNEPDDYNETQDYAGIALAGWPQWFPGYYGSPGEWNDLDGNNALYFVVEKDIKTSERDLISGAEISVTSKTEKLLVTVSEQALGQQFAIYNTLSKLVMTGTLENENHEIDVSTLSSGIYIFKMNGDVNKTFKFIKR